MVCKGLEVTWSQRTRTLAWVRLGAYGTGALCQRYKEKTSRNMRTPGVAWLVTVSLCTPLFSSPGVRARMLCRVWPTSTCAIAWGMAPGFCAPPDLECPLARKLVYGSPSFEPVAVHQLTRLLLARVNHTGSDVRISTGAIMNPKAYPRQSANSAWWQWRHVFQCRWGKLSISTDSNSAASF